jgi:hypothetical protein
VTPVTGKLVGLSRSENPKLAEGPCQALHVAQTSAKAFRKSVQMQRRPFGNDPVPLLTQRYARNGSPAFPAPNFREITASSGLGTRDGREAREWDAAEIISNRLSDFVAATMIATMTAGRHSGMAVQGLTAGWSSSGVPSPIRWWHYRWQFELEGDAFGCVTMHSVLRATLRVFSILRAFVNRFASMQLAQKGLEIRCSIRLSYGPAL